MPWVWVNGHPKWVAPGGETPVGARRTYKDDAEQWSGTAWTPYTPPPVGGGGATTPPPGTTPAPAPTPAPTPAPAPPPGPVDQYGRARTRENQDYETATERLAREKAEYEADYGTAKTQLGEDRTRAEAAYQQALQRLGVSQDISLKNLVESLNQQNLFWGGYRGVAEGDLARQFGDRRTDLNTGWEGQQLGYTRRGSQLDLNHERALQDFLNEAADLLLGHNRELEDISFAQSEAARIRRENAANNGGGGGGGGGYPPDSEPPGGGGEGDPELEPLNPPPGLAPEDRNWWFGLDPDQQHDWMKRVQNGGAYMSDGTYMGPEFWYWDEEWGWTPRGFAPGMAQGEIVGGRYRWNPSTGWQVVSPVTDPGRGAVTTIGPGQPGGQDYGDPFMGGPQGGRRTTDPGTGATIDPEVAAQYDPEELASLAQQYPNAGYDLFYWWVYMNYPSPRERDQLMADYPEWAGAIDEAWYDAMKDRTGIGGGQGQQAV